MYSSEKLSYRIGELAFRQKYIGVGIPAGTAKLRQK